MSERLTKAMQARRDARKRNPGDPLRYAAWRNVTSCERDLTDDEFAAYIRWANDTRLTTAKEM